MTNTPVDQSRLARNGQEYLDLVLSDADWIVRAPDDLMQLRETNSGPLAKMPEHDFRVFVDGLKFNAGGVGGGSYRALMFSLTISEIFEVFERFGMSPEYTRDTLEEKCEGGSCKRSFWNFCSSTCGHIVAPKE